MERNKELCQSDSIFGYFLIAMYQTIVNLTLVPYGALN